MFYLGAPKSLQVSTAAQLEDTFLVLGGYSGSPGYRQTIYEFDPVNYGWVLRDQELRVPLDGVAAVAMPRGSGGLQC